MLGFATTGFCEEEKKDKLDLSTPKKAYKEFLKTAFAGNADQLEKCITPAPKGIDELQKKMIKFTALSYSFFSKMSEKYGDEFKKALPEGSTDSMPKPEDVDELECEINGDTATLTAKDSDTKTPPIKLKKIDGKWRVELFAEGVPDKRMVGFLSSMMDQAIKMFEKGHKLIGKEGETAKSILDALKPSPSMDNDSKEK